MSERKEKFTDGDWSYQRGQYGDAQVKTKFTNSNKIHGSSETICVLNDNEYLVYEDFDEQDANGYLMAQSPNLYRNLNEAVIQMCFHCPSGEATQGAECTFHGDCFVKEWRETLKKARGEK